MAMYQISSFLGSDCNTINFDAIENIKHNMWVSFDFSDVFNIYNNFIYEGYCYLWCNTDFDFKLGYTEDTLSKALEEYFKNEEAVTLIMMTDKNVIYPFLHITIKKINTKEFYDPDKKLSTKDKIILKLLDFLSKK